jgi:hypothetical protein
MNTIAAASTPAAVRCPITWVIFSTIGDYPGQR